MIQQYKIIENCKKMVQMAKDNNIDYVMLVVKILAGHFDFVDKLAKTGISHIGDSRIQNLKKLMHIKLPKVLVRIPMISEANEVVQYADISLNSEIKTIKALNQAAKNQQKKHQIILMFDLGDLREGIYHSSSYLTEIDQMMELKHIEIVGIGTNLTCYGGLIPSKDVLMRLVKIKDKIEETYGIKLKYISGGNSSTVTLFGQDNIPKAINSLRLGESIFFGLETSFSTPIPGLNQDNFILEAQLIECQVKPSLPEGETSINSFGEKVSIEDQGLMKRGILAIGKQDVMFENITPIDSDIEIIGGSSDHLIVNLHDKDYQVGDILQFKLNYPSVLHLMNSDYVYKQS